ncbi:MAG: YjjG family noncanonical pyrimidine nucleotidase [Chitinivibrionales bacterium]
MMEKPPAISSYTWILFDADGTIFDYQRCERDALKETLTKFGITYNTDNTEALLTEYNSINQRLWKAFEENRIDSESVKTERFISLFKEFNISGIAPESFSRAYLESISTQHSLVPEAYSTLKRLSEVKNLAVVTNGFRNTQNRRISLAGIDRFFREVITSQDSGITKPDKRFFSYTFKKTGIQDRSRVLIVGDSLTSDILGGINAGIDTCWYNPEGKECTEGIPLVFQVSSLHSLIEGKITG